MNTEPLSPFRKLTRDLKEFAETAVCPVADHCVSGFVSGAYTGWGWARERAAKFASRYTAGYPDDAVVLYKDGDQWCAVRQDFINLAESDAGFGYTADEAINQLAA